VIDIRCNDMLIPIFEFPVTLIASSEGPHGELTLDPSAMTFQGRAGQTQTQQLKLTNHGATSGYVERAVVDHENNPGTFQISSRFPAVAARQSDQLTVSCTPRGSRKRRQPAHPRHAEPPRPRHPQHPAPRRTRRQRH
jgi:hypothetical protein